MHKFQFTPDDLFINRLKTYPEYNVFIYQGQMFVNSESRISGSGGLVVYDVNRNLTGSENLRVQPFLETNSEKPLFKSQRYQPLLKNATGEYQFFHDYQQRIVSDSGLLSSYVFSTSSATITSSYGFESPIKRNLAYSVSSLTHNFFNLNTGNTGSQFVDIRVSNLTASALQNVARKYTHLSHHFMFTPLNDEERVFFQSSSLNGRDLVYDNNSINFITIPSMYYGSTIKKGSVELNYYIEGSKVRTCADIRNNGELIETTCSNGDATGSVVGLVMYDEGIVLLTSSAGFSSSGIHYISSSSGTQAASDWWKYYGTTLNDGTSSAHPTLASASYDLNFKGTSYVNTMTMFAHARKGHLNHSNNPTYRTDTLLSSVLTGSGKHFVEGTYGINNIVSASYTSASFDKTTYISKVHIYDEDGNLIAITSLAKPIKKTLEDEYTFKMKLDL